jgi:hypothetical protein
MQVVRHRARIVAFLDMRLYQPTERFSRHRVTKSGRIENDNIVSMVVSGVSTITGTRPLAGVWFSLCPPDPLIRLQAELFVENVAERSRNTIIPIRSSPCFRNIPCMIDRRPTVTSRCTAGEYHDRLLKLPTDVFSCVFRYILTPPRITHITGLVTTRLTL